MLFLSMKGKLQGRKTYVYACLCVLCLPACDSIFVYLHIFMHYIYLHTFMHYYNALSIYLDINGKSQEGAHQNIYNGWLLLLGKEIGEQET